MSDPVWPLDCSTPGFPVLRYLPEFAQTHDYWVSDAIQLSHPLSSPFSSCLQIFPSIRVSSSESALWIRWPKYWSFSFSISPSNECSGLISFRIDWFDLLAIQGTLKINSKSTKLGPWLYAQNPFTFVITSPKSSNETITLTHLPILKGKRLLYKDISTMEWEFGVHFRISAYWHCPMTIEELEKIVKKLPLMKNKALDQISFLQTLKEHILQWFSKTVL